HYFVFGVIETYRIIFYPVCFYDPKYKIMANHHGITFDDLPLFCIWGHRNIQDNGKSSWDNF
ncbi:DUF4049 domain-containing protein, partial [Shigella flexneri]|nr:DUF4049 domain-containing protein [Shigella flexneri]